MALNMSKIMYTIGVNTAKQTSAITQVRQKLDIIISSHLQLLGNNLNMHKRAFKLITKTQLILLTSPMEIMKAWTTGSLLLILQRNLLAHILQIMLLTRAMLCRDISIQQHIHQLKMVSISMSTIQAQTIQQPLWRLTALTTTQKFTSHPTQTRQATSWFSTEKWQCSTIWYTTAIIDMLLWLTLFMKMIWPQALKASHISHSSTKNLTTISTLQKTRDHMTYMQIFGQLILQTLNILHISFLEQLIQG